MVWCDGALFLFASVSPEGSVKVNPPVVIGSVGDNVTFTCESQGGPGNTIQWSRNGSKLTNMMNELLKVSTINPVTDGGNYTCLVGNTAGNASATVYLYMKPMMTLEPTNITTIYGSRVNFSCKADGYPLPMYYWEKEERNGSFTQVPNSSNQSLIFHPVVFDDIGRYQCIATVNFPVGSINNTSIKSVIATLTSKLQLISLLSEHCLYLFQCNSIVMNN